MSSLQQLLNIPFFEACPRRFDEDADGTRRFKSVEEKNCFDRLESLSISQLYAETKGVPSNKFPIDITDYLVRRGLFKEVGYIDCGKYQMPEYGWKDVNEINWFEAHTPQKTRLEEPEGRDKVTITFDLPPRYSKAIKG